MQDPALAAQTKDEDVGVDWRPGPAGGQALSRGCHHLEGADDAETVVLRPSLVYGPDVGGNLREMLRAVKRGYFPPPPRIANRRAMVHVDDVVRVACVAGEHPGAAGRTYVIGDGEKYSTRDIYERMLLALGRRVPAWSFPGPCWRAAAVAGDALGALRRRRAPFDSGAYRKLFGSAWYDPSDLRELGVTTFLTLDDALPEMLARS